MTKSAYSRPVSFLICLLVYLIALAVSVVFIYYFENNMNRLWLILFTIIIATILVFAFSAVFKNSSLYDPYWSVAPPLMAWYWLISGSNDLGGYLMVFAIMIWSIRLTFNWCRGWKGLSHEDWRYKMLREKNPGLYPLVNFAGIHLFPTIMVFLGMQPVYVATSRFMDSVITNPLFMIGLLITLVATAIEFIADEQMHQFKKHAKNGEYIQSGLWKYSRHPNYFGEITFWFGLWVMQMAVAPEYWWTAIGCIAMLLMFLFASIPMMEKRNIRSKISYDSYIKRVSMLIPLPSKRNI